MTCPWTELDRMEYRALRYGTGVTNRTTRDNVTILKMTDGSIIKLTVDPEALVYELKRYIPDSEILLYSQGGAYEQ